MKSIRNFVQKKPKLSNVLMWLLAAILTLACFAYQDKTGPTYPLEGELQTAKGVVKYKVLRSETIGTDLKIMLLDPVPEGVSGYVKYRRFKSDDTWSTKEIEKGSFSFSRRGREEFVEGMGVELPSLSERAGKYEFFVFIDDGEGEPVSITKDKAIYARYKGSVPMLVLLVHILLIFLSMAIAIRTIFETLINGNFKPYIWATIISLIFAAFILGPLVQWYAFGVWWSGIPFGYDWTDNKVVLEMVFWLIAAYQNRASKVNRTSVYIAGLVTLIVYFIPHSLFGSEYNYTTGEGTGTAG